MLLTDRLQAPRRQAGGWAPIPAVSYYWHAAGFLLDAPVPECPDASLPHQARLELGITPDQSRAAAALLGELALERTPFAVLNPGGNNPAKRWPAERFAALAAWLVERHGLAVLVSGSPGEHDLAEGIARDARGHLPADAPPVHSIAGAATLGSLKGVLGAARLLVTNDTGPRHIAAAFRIPVVTLFGPTDHRWTTIPAPAGEALLLADPTLPPEQVADDHPERCRIDRITLDQVTAAAGPLLARGAASGPVSVPVRPS